MPTPIRGAGGSTNKLHFQPYTPPSAPEPGQPSRTIGSPPATPSGQVVVDPAALLTAPSVSAGNVAANTNQTATLAVSVVVGASLKVFVVTGGSGQTVLVTDSAGNTYQPQSAVAASAGTIETGQWFECGSSVAALTAGSSTISAQRSTSGSIGFIALTSNNALISGGTPVHDNGGVQATNFSNSAGNPVGTAMTIDVAGSCSYAGIGWGNITGTLTPSAGWTLLQQAPMSGTGNPRSLAVIYRSSTSPETVTPGGTLTTGNTYVVAGIADKAANPTVVFSATSTLTADATISSANSTASLTATSTLTASGTLTKAHPTHARIGDSLTWRGGSDANPPSREATTRALDQAYAITANASSEYWYAVGGKPMSGNDSNGNDVFFCISAAQVQLGTPDTWFIGLGTNDVALSDAAFIAAVQAIMAAIGSTGQVFWMNLAFFNVANTNAGHFNPILASTLSAYSNVTLLDWNTYIHGATYDTADWISPVDATHMTPQGWAKRDNFIDTAIALATQSAVAMTATSTLSATATQTSGGVTQPGGAALVATSTLTVTAVRQPEATTTLIATSTLTATADRDRPATTTLIATSTLTATAVRTQVTTTALVGVSTLTATVVRTQVITTALAGVSTLTVNADRTRVATAALVASSTLTATGDRTQVTTTALVATSTLTATGIQTGTQLAATSLLGSSTLTVTAVRTQAATVAFVAGSTLSAVAVRQPQAATTLTGTSTLTATGVRTRVVTVALVATSTLTATGLKPSAGTAVGTYDFTGVATGAKVAVATAVGAYDFAGLAAGTKLTIGVATGGYDLSGVATGTKPGSSVTYRSGGTTLPVTILGHRSGASILPARPLGYRSGDSIAALS